MEEKIVIALVRVLEGGTGEVEVVDAGGISLPGHDGMCLDGISEFPVGTVLKVTFQETGNGLLVIGLEETTTTLSAEEEVDDIPFNGWEKIGTEWFSPEEREIFNTARVLAEAQQAFNVLVIGDSGYGKTSRGKAIAEDYGMQYVRVDVSMYREPEEMFFWREARATDTGGTETVSLPTQLTQALRGGNALIQLDELNRAEPWVLDPLLPILDFARRTFLRDQEIVVGQNVLFVATINEGFQFTGTFTLDQALRNRFAATMLVAAPPKEVEIEIVKEKCAVDADTAETIIRVLNNLRNSNEEAFQSISMSTRSAIQVALLHSKGMSLMRAFTVVIINDSPETARRQIIDIINSELRR